MTTTMELSEEAVAIFRDALCFYVTDGMAITRPDAPTIAVICVALGLEDKDLAPYSLAELRGEEQP